MTHDNFGILHFFPTTQSSDHEHVAHLVVQGFTETSWTLKLLYNLNTISHLYGDLYTIVLLIIMPNHASAGWHIKAKLCFIQIMCCFADFKHARIVDLLHYASNTWSFFQRASSNIGRAGRCELPIWHQDTLACWPCQFPETRPWVVQDLTFIALDDWTCLYKFAASVQVMHVEVLLELWKELEAPCFRVLSLETQVTLQPQAAFVDTW